MVKAEIKRRLKELAHEYRITIRFHERSTHAQRKTFLQSWFREPAWVLPIYDGGIPEIVDVHRRVNQDHIVTGISAGCARLECGDEG